MKRRPVRFMHTIDGRPARFEKDPWPALIAVNGGDRGEVLTVASSYRTICRQQVAAITALPATVALRESGRFGYVRVR